MENTLLNYYYQLLLITIKIGVHIYFLNYYLSNNTHVQLLLNTIVQLVLCTTRYYSIIRTETYSKNFL
jgi:hypothetical protein